MTRSGGFPGHPVTSLLRHFAHGPALSCQVASDVPRAEPVSVPIVRVPVRSVGAGATSRLPTANPLEPVSDALLRLPLVVFHGKQESAHEDGHAPQFVPVHRPQLREEPAGDGHHAPPPSSDGGSGRADSMATGFGRKSTGSARRSTSSHPMGGRSASAQTEQSG